MNLNVSKFIDIKLKNVQEDVLIIITEQILTLNLIQTMNKDVIVQSNTFIIDENTIIQLNASVIN